MFKVGHNLSINVEQGTDKMFYMVWKDTITNSTIATNGAYFTREEAEADAKIYEVGYSGTREKP